MVLALGTLILIQAYWIQNAIALREQQFKRNVNQALVNVANKVEQRDAIKLIKSNQLLAGNVIPYSDQYENRPLSKQAKAEINSQTNSISQFVEAVMKDEGSLPDINIDLDTTLAVDSSCKTIYHSTINLMINDSVKTVTVTHSNKDKITQTLSASQKKIASKKEAVGNAFFQFFGVERSIEERLSGDELAYLLDQELANRGITTPYEFVVLNGFGSPVIKSEAYIPQMLNASHQVLLFPNDLFSEPNSLMLYFPEQKRFIVSSLGMMSFSSIGLILLISLCFAYTIYVIYRQKKLSDMKTDFINNMTHELKTPVATISLASEMLMDSRIQDDHNRLARFASVIHEENKRLGGQVEKVLQMAVLDKGEFKLNPVEINVHEVLERLNDKFSLRLEERSGTCNLHLNADNPMIVADEVHFTNILTNLVDNAIKYSSNAPQVDITTEDAVGGIKIHVADKGIGMNREQQKRVFEKFYRVPTGNIHNVKGFGLGLSYVQVMVEAHGGSIDLKSELYKGSTFTIFMPYKSQE